MQQTLAKFNRVALKCFIISFVLLTLFHRMTYDLSDYWNFKRLKWIWISTRLWEHNQQSQLGVASFLAPTSEVNGMQRMSLYGVAAA